MITYRCEDSLEGIFTAIYQAYEEKRDHEDTFLSLTDEPLLFSQDIEVVPDQEKTVKVINTLKKRFGEKDYYTLCLALATESDEKAQAVYQTVVKGLKCRCRPGHLFDDLADDSVHRAFALARNANREAGHQIEFVRFQELENKVLYSKIGPKCNVLTFIMPHFADRFPIENFVIYDDRRNLFGIHPAGRQWYLLHGEEAGEPKTHCSDKEEEYQALFRHFCRTIAIKERRNLVLQRNMLPLRFQEYMTEFR